MPAPWPPPGPPPPTPTPTGAPDDPPHLARRLRGRLHPVEPGRVPAAPLRHAPPAGAGDDEPGAPRAPRQGAVAVVERPPAQLGRDAAGRLPGLDAARVGAGVAARRDRHGG